MKNSEILMNILNKMSTIESLITLNDYQQKLIIKKLNEITKEKPEVIAEKPSGPGGVISPDPSPEVAASDIKEKKDKLMSLSRGNKSEGNDYKFDIRDTNSEALNSKEKSITIPVTQKISSKVISSADVTIKNFDGEVVAKTATNTTGRWQVMLAPGSYVVDVNGKGDAGNISYTQSFDVEKSPHPIVLPVPEMYKRQ